MIRPRMRIEMRVKPREANGVSGDPTQQRRSIRRFAPRDVSKALIEEMLEAARRLRR